MEIGELTVVDTGVDIVDVIGVGADDDKRFVVTSRAFVAISGLVTGVDVKLVLLRIDTDGAQFPWVDGVNGRLDEEELRVPPDKFSASIQCLSKKII